MNSESIGEMDSNPNFDFKNNPKSAGTMFTQLLVSKNQSQ